MNSTYLLSYTQSVVAAFSAQGTPATFIEVPDLGLSPRTAVLTLFFLDRK
jgi:hypothetical protein